MTDSTMGGGVRQREGSKHRGHFSGHRDIPFFSMGSQEDVGLSQANESAESMQNFVSQRIQRSIPDSEDLSLRKNATGSSAFALRNGQNIKESMKARATLLDTVGYK